METLGIYRAFSRAPFMGYRAKVIALAGLAAAFPFAGWLAPGEGLTRAVTIGTSLAGSILATICVAAMLRPVGLAARALRDCAEAGSRRPCHSSIATRPDG